MAIVEPHLDLEQCTRRWFAMVRTTPVLCSRMWAVQRANGPGSEPFASQRRLQRRPRCTHLGCVNLPPTESDKAAV